MKSTVLVFLGGVVMLSSSAIAVPVTCQSVLAVGSGNFQSLETAGVCSIGNIDFSGFNTSMNATNLLASTDGGAGTGFSQRIGLSYTYFGGSLPAGTIGYTATFDAASG